MAKEHFRDENVPSEATSFVSIFCNMCISTERKVSHMKKGLTELVFILDRSGSMGGLESDTIGGFNGMLGKQKKEEGEAYVTTVLFDDQIDIIHDRFPISVVEPLSENDYFVRGCTALLDAVGSTVKKVENIQKRLPEEMRAENIIFVITTDGQENASQEYSVSMVKKMIEANQEKGWQFLFLGANMDAVEEADKIGIRRTHAVSYRPTSKGVRLNYEVAGSVLSCMRSDDCSMEEKMQKVPEFLRPIEQYFDEE